VSSLAEDEVLGDPIVHRGDPGDAGGVDQTLGRPLDDERKNQPGDGLPSELTGGDWDFRGGLGFFGKWVGGGSSLIFDCTAVAKTMF
jgi:hypothetical protein